jgi:hypothetical protein
MESKSNKGGKRNNAGRKRTSNPKKAIVIYVDRSNILKFGSEEKVKEKVYGFINSFGSEIEIKNTIDTPKTETPTYKETTQFNIPTQPIKFRRTESFFIASMKDLDKDDTNAIFQLKKEAEESTDISERQRVAILHSLKNGTY